MSNDTNTVTTDAATDEKVTTAKVTRTRKQKSARTYTVSQLAAIVAERKGIDTSRAGKLVRSKLRANFDTVTKLDPSVKKVKTAANDGNRWPAMNANVRAMVLGEKVK